jgi:hypothetical protein
MKIFQGTICENDIDVAIRNAKQAKPGVKNLYMRIDKNSNLQFIVRKKKEDGVCEQVVYSIKCKSSDVDEYDPHFDNELIRGFSMCISIPKYEEFNIEYEKLNGKKYTKGMLFDRHAMVGTCVACSWSDHSKKLEV